MDLVDVSRFAFGEGAFVEDGVAVPVKFSNCEGTVWVRAIDGNMIADLAEDGVNLMEIMRPGEQPDEVVLHEDAEKIIVENRDKYQKLVRRVLVKFDGFKRINGTPIPFSADMHDKLAGYPVMVVVVIMAGFQAAQELVGNSESSSDGTDSQTEDLIGEPIFPTVESVV